MAASRRFIPRFTFAIVNDIPIVRKDKFGRSAGVRREAFIQFAYQHLPEGMTLVYVPDIDESTKSVETLFYRRFPREQFKLSRRGEDWYVTKLATPEPFERRSLKGLDPT